MSQERIELGKNPRLTIECHGNLVLRGWGETAVLIKAAEYETNEDENGLEIVSHGDLKCTVPVNTALAIRAVHGDLIIKQVSSDISLNEVNGDAVLSGVSRAKLGVVHGDLSARQIDGSISAETINGDAVCRQLNDVTLGTVHGDVSVRHASGSVSVQTGNGDVNLEYVEGDVTLQQGHRDVNVRHIGGLVQIQQASGDVRLRGGLPEGDHFCQAHGDIVVRWPVDAPLNLEATAPGIKNNLPLEGVSEDGQTLTGSLGAGKTHLKLVANGRIILKEGRLVKEEWLEGDEEFAFDFDFDFNNLGERISREVEAQVGRFAAGFESQFGPDFAQKMTERITRQTEKAVAKAERAAERAQRQAERQVDRQRRHTARWGAPPAPPAPPKPPKPSAAPKATPEEQLKILKMVEQGIISPEEANTLLEAIEGQA